MDLFARLAQQALEHTAATAVQPRLPARFEPGGVLAQGVVAPDQSDAVAYHEASETPPASQRQPAAANQSPDPAAHQLVSTISAPIAPQQTLTPPAQPHAAALHQTINVPRQAAETLATAAVVAPAIVVIPTPTATVPRATSSPIMPRRTTAIVPASAQSPRAAARDRADAAPAAPVIRVSIGRVEVRAVTRPAAPAPRPAPAPQPMSDGLENYLRADKGGRSR